MRHTNKIVLTGAVFVAVALVASMAVGSVAASEHEGGDSGLTFENQSLNDNGEVTVEMTESVAEEGNYVFVTYLDEDRPGSPETILAGRTDISGNDTVATVEIEDAGGFPGEHTAHVITRLSTGSRYEPGKLGISETTLSNVIASETADVSDDYDVYEPTPNVATATFENQTSDGDTVTVASTFLPDGGFVTIHNDSLLDGDALGSVVGTSEYLGPGEHEDVEVEVDLHDEPGGEHAHTYIAMPHHDTNGNEEYDFVEEEGGADGPYTANGSAVTNAASVTIGSSMDDGSDDGMDDGSMDDGSMDDGTDDGTDDGKDDGMDDGMDDGNESEDGMEDDSSDGNESDDGGQGMPGFTAVAGLVALLSVALIAARRNE